ncbi:MAG TPA: helix-turn-helix domain-containing protein [Thermoplasmata archaeon]|nr:helix-turn-helix domain-containing protein [Thermoplasmata archaeon]
MLAARGYPRAVAQVNAHSDLSIVDHPTRQRILAYLAMLPGDHFRSIGRTLQISMGSTRHHLSVLVKKGLVRSERMGGKLRYFAIARGSTSPLNDTFKQYWKYRDLRMRVWSAVRQQREASPSNVAASLGVSRQLAAYHLACLEELGLVVRARGRYRAVDPDRRTVDFLWATGERGPRMKRT